jgi:hypothetical protein
MAWAEADADDRQLAAHAGQQLRHAAGFARRPGPGESISTGFSMVPRRSISGCAGTGCGKSPRYGLGAQLICQVIGKGVDIIEQQNVSHQKISFA